MVELDTYSWEERTVEKLVNFLDEDDRIIIDIWSSSYVIPRELTIKLPHPTHQIMQIITNKYKKSPSRVNTTRIIIKKAKKKNKLFPIFPSSFKLVLNSKIDLLDFIYLVAVSVTRECAKFFPWVV